MRGLDRPPRLRGAHARHRGEDRARRRVADVEGRAVVGVDPAAVDEPLAQQEVAGERAHPRALVISAQLATCATFVIAYSSAARCHSSPVVEVPSEATTTS